MQLEANSIHTNAIQVNPIRLNSIKVKFIEMRVGMGTFERDFWRRIRQDRSRERRPGRSAPTARRRFRRFRCFRRFRLRSRSASWLRGSCCWPPILKVSILTISINSIQLIQFQLITSTINYRVQSLKLWKYHHSLLNDEIL